MNFIFDKKNESLIIKWLIAHNSMSVRKLQSIFYYEYGWTLAFNNSSVNSLNTALCPVQFVTTSFGVISLKLQKALVKSDYYYTNDIVTQYGDLKNLSKQIYNLTDKKTLDSFNSIYKIYSNLSGNQFTQMMVQSKPWQDAQKNNQTKSGFHNLLDDKSIYQYFTKIANN